MIVINNIIVAIEPGDQLYDEVYMLISSKPIAPTGFNYELKADTLEWELVELPPIDNTDDEATESDYIDALQNLGVDV